MTSMDDPRRLYLNPPTKGPSSVFAVLFAVSAIFHIFQNTKYKCWQIFWLFPCNAIIFVAGFISLEYNAFHPTAFAPSQGLLYSAAAILLASLILCLMYLVATQRDTARYWSFTLSTLVMLILSAIISLTAQGTASYYSPGATPQNVRSSLGVLKAGVVLLLFANLAFLGLLGLFHHRCSKSGLFRDKPKRKVKIMIFALYLSATLLLVRNIFRTVQIFSSADAAAWTSEAFFWVFDASPSLICMLLLNVLPPIKVTLTRDGSAH